MYHFECSKGRERLSLSRVRINFQWRREIVWQPLSQWRCLIWWHKPDTHHHTPFNPLHNKQGPIQNKAHLFTLSWAYLDVVLLTAVHEDTEAMEIVLISDTLTKKHW